jgi:hypothetical protein
MEMIMPEFRGSSGTRLIAEIAEVMAAIILSFPWI